MLPILQGVTCSPFGAVPKGDADLTVDGRVIHDLSHPKGASVNDQELEESGVVVTYDGAAILAKRALHVAALHPGAVRMSTGDVEGAFRNIRIAAEAAGRFSATIPELGILVIDLCCSDPPLLNPLKDE